MAEIRRGHEGGSERLPWLEPVEDEDAYPDTGGSGRLALLGVLALVAVGVVVAGVMLVRHWTAGRADIGQIIRAPDGPYKERPVHPGGLRLQGSGVVAEHTGTGTDIDARIVARARTGRFDAQDARDAPKSMLRRFFTQEDDGTWTAGEDLRKLVRFEQGDLLRLGRRQEAYDLVLCRNTVIYFNEDVRDALHARLAASLRPGGYLVVGATERIADPAALGLSGPLPFTYRKDA